MFAVWSMRGWRMAKHPKPHFVKHQGKWLACYGNRSLSDSTRVLGVIAEGETLLIAHCNYLEKLEPQAQFLASRVLSVRKGRIDRIIAAWRRLRGKT